MVTTDMDTGESTTFEIECSSDSEILDCPAYIPEDIPTEYGIIGTDERYQVPDMLRGSFPYSCIGEVYISPEYIRCSASVVKHKCERFLFKSSIFINISNMLIVKKV